jgi:hypothetical protein
MDDPRHEYQVLDNIIPPSYQDMLEELHERGLPWHYTPSTSGEDIKKDPNDERIVDFPQFHHVYCDTDGITSPQFFPLIEPLVWFLEKTLDIRIKSFGRIKSNFMLPGNSTLDNYNVPHIDHPNEDHISMVYYVNDSDGCTRIFDKTVSEGYEKLLPIAEISPKKGRAVVFKSNRFHASTPPVNASKRMVINFVLQV